MRNTRPLHVVALAAVATLLAACGGAPEAAPAPTPPKPTATATATSQQAPVVSSDVRLPGERGAKAAIAAYSNALNFAASTGDTAPLRQRFAETCTRCIAIADDIDRTYSEGGSFSGGDWQIASIKYYGAQNGVAVLDARISYPAQQWIESEGAEAVTYSGATDELHAFQMSQRNDEWVVGALDPQS